jgi:hypothetical protein
MTDPTLPSPATASSQIQLGLMTVRGLVAKILASNTYFNSPAVMGSNAAWVNQIFLDMVNIPGSITDPNYNIKVTNLNNGTTRLAIAQSVVYSDQVIKQTITEYFEKFLGRSPVRNADPALDETTNFNGVNLTALLETRAVPGTVSPDQQLIAMLVSTPEYLRVVGNSNFEWVRQLFLKVLGRPTIDTSPTPATSPFNSTLNTLLTNYSAARLSVLQTITGGQEFRNRVFTSYYDQFLSFPGHPRVPTAAELVMQQGVYAANNNRLEAVAANILSSGEFFPLSGGGSDNATWLANVYQLLLGRNTSNDPTANGQVTFLNNNLANLQQARFTVALQVLNSTEYRQRLVAGFLNTYLGEPFNPLSTDVAQYVALLNGGTRQEAIIRQILLRNDFFLSVT